MSINDLEIRYFMLAQRQHWTREELERVRNAVSALALCTPWSTPDILSYVEDFAGADWSLTKILAALVTSQALRGAWVMYRFGDPLRETFPGTAQKRKSLLAQLALIDSPGDDNG